MKLKKPFTTALGFLLLLALVLTALPGAVGESAAFEVEQAPFANLSNPESLIIPDEPQITEHPYREFTHDALPSKGKDALIHATPASYNYGIFTPGPFQLGAMRPFKAKIGVGETAADYATVTGKLIRAWPPPSWRL